jgi:multicomponent Na+:H+ antiporter subunit D
MTMLVVPILLPWVLAAVFALLDGRKSWIGWLSVVGLAVSFASVVALTFAVVQDGPVELVAGGWPEGVGISLRADALGVTFAALSMGVVLVSLAYEVIRGVRSRTFPALVLFLATGLSGLFLTGDIFNFYVFFEISMTAAYALTSYRERDYQIRAAFIFAIINLLGSVVFLISVAALYHVTGSLDMQIVAERIEDVAPNSIITIAVAVFVAFSLKLGLFPFHFWLPAVYMGSHAPVAAILSGALANIGSYGLLRFGAGILPKELALGVIPIFILGAASIIYGAVQAISRHATVEVLAYSAIGQAGYILIALAIGGTVGYGAAVVYAVVNSLNKALLFLAAGTRGPLVGAAFAIGAFSVVGVPPAAGFLGKLALFKASLTVESLPASIALVALIFLGGALSFLYVFELYGRVFLKPDETDRKNSPLAARVLVLSIGVVVLAVGVWPEPLLVLANTAGDLLSNGGI